MNPVSHSDAVAANPVWYHTIALPGGASTPGHVDWRGHAERLLGDDLTGLNALDVGTYDGFWAFEMERRGAAVVAIDLDHIESSHWPPVHRATLLAESDRFGVELGRGFRIAKSILGSEAERIACDVQSLTPEAVGGTKDLVFLGALLLHLRDPVGALENVRRTLVPGGRLILLEAISLPETLRHPRTPLARFDTAANAFNWWLPNRRTLHHWLWAAGFVDQRNLGLPMRPPGLRQMRGWYSAIEARAPVAPG